MSMEMNKALDLLREIRPSIPKEVLELWCKDRDAFIASHPAAEQAGGDERAAFEAAFAAMGRPVCRADYDQDAYGTPFDDGGWTGWQARAALAQPSPAPTLRAAIDVANDRFEVPVAKWGTDLAGEEERPEVAEVAFVLRNIGAMDAEDIDGDNVDLRFEDAEGRDTGCDVSIVEYAEKAADLFEQHDRIVGELRADRDSWAEQAEQRLADWDEMRKERDAALVEVERLSESKGDPVGSFEKCMKVMYERDENAKRLEVALARVAEYEAQAQHSVPGNAAALVRAEAKKYSLNAAGMLDSGAPEHAQTFAIVQLLSEFDDEEAESHWEAIMAYSDFRTSDALFRAAELLAAAPGKEVGHE